MMHYDIAVIGGGINGVGIARDAAGRGLRTLLIERSDLACATSSASSKLAHGGLRYLEQYRFGMVAEALAERETLLRCAPHIVRPMRFVVPMVPGLRPAWLIRTGLFLYDHLARRQRLPRSRRVDLRTPAYSGLKEELTRGYAYSDCWVDDARLVIATASSAAQLGASVLTRTACVEARRAGADWQLRLQSADGARSVASAKVLVNATGPWVAQFLADIAGAPVPFRIELVQGSHIVVPRLYPGDHAIVLQNPDGRVVFVYPYERDYTLVGTTEAAVHRPGQHCEPTAQELGYLCAAANAYFEKQITPRDIVWSFCGMRPLVFQAGRSASELSRFSQIVIDARRGEAPLLSVVGGKITSYRRLAERVMGRLQPWLKTSGPWTANAPLPGGALAHGDTAGYLAELARRYPRLPSNLLASVAARHGSLTPDVLGPAAGVPDLGQPFGTMLYAREIDYLMDREWAHSAEDVLWRRTKEGLHLTSQQRAAVERYMRERVRMRPAAGSASGEPEKGVTAPAAGP